MKKALIISCNDNYDYDTRTKYVEFYLKNNGYEVTFLISDFDHRNKNKYICTHNGNIDYIKVMPYKKNISIKRIISHFNFGNGVFRYLNKYNFDIVYHCAPPNWTIRKLSQNRKRKQFFLITEIADMWPESIPMNNKAKGILKFPFRVWANIRNKNLYNSDIVIAECELFKHYLDKKCDGLDTKLLYFCKEYVPRNYEVLPDVEKEINILYLGSINNIIDIDEIKLIIEKISEDRNVNVYVIGDGEKKNDFLSELDSTSARVFYYGKIFDENEKKQIYNKCHFALNIMKSNVFVGMTMKSLDYFAYGIPIINNIKGDTWNLVDSKNCGVNITHENIDATIEKIIKLTKSEYLKMNLDVMNMQNEYFSQEAFYKKMKSFIDSKMAY